MKRNIILLHTDQQRWDSLGCYGNAAAKTPHLDRLSAEDVRFDHHYVSNPVCMPSRASLMTGRHLPAHGVLDNGIALDDREKTIAGALADEGYDTFAAGKLHLTPYLSPESLKHGESFAAWRSGVFDDWDGPYYGFRRVALVEGHGEGPVNPSLGHYGKWLAERHPEVFERTGYDIAPEPKWPVTFRSQVPPELHNSAYIAERVIEYLEKCTDGKPFFIFAGFPDPHHPFTPPETYATMFDSKEFPEPHFREGEHDGKPEHYARLMSEHPFAKDGGSIRAPGGEHLHHIIQNTYAMVTLIDHSIGRILDAVQRLGLAENTIVCFTCDHGEFLGDHGLIFKAQLPYATLMRVPLIIRAPGVSQRVVNAPISNVDVMPTLMELAGVACPPGVQGTSYTPVMTGERDRIRAAAFSCGWSKDSPLFRHMSLHSDEWRITWWPGQQDGELYDIKADPYEYENLFNRREHRVTRDGLMADLLRAYADAGPLEPRVLCNW